MFRDVKKIFFFTALFTLLRLILFQFLVSLCIVNSAVQKYLFFMFLPFFYSLTILVYILHRVREQASVLLSV